MAKELLDIFVCLSIVLILTALFLNLLNLIVIRFGKTSFNATEVLQMVKTFLIMTSLLTLSPLDVICMNTFAVKSSFLVTIKGVLEDLILGAYPMTVQAVAITRWRVCKCTGNSNVLVTRISAFVTLMACLVFPVFAAVGSLLMMKVNLGQNSLEERTTWCNASTEPSLLYFNIASVSITTIVPSVVTVCIYCVIHRKIYVHDLNMRTKTRSTSNSVKIQITNVPITPKTKKSTTSVRSNKDSSHIFVSLYLLLGVYLLSLLPYIFMTLNNMVSTPNEQFTMFLIIAFNRILICLLHPIGDGILQDEKRKRLSNFLRKLTTTCFKRTSVVGSINNDNNTSSRTVIHTCSKNIRDCALPTLFEETSGSDKTDVDHYSPSVYRQRSAHQHPSAFSRLDVASLECENVPTRRLNDIRGHDAHRCPVIVIPRRGSALSIATGSMGSSGTISTIGQELILPTYDNNTDREFEVLYNDIRLIPASCSPSLQRSNSSPSIPASPLQNPRSGLKKLVRSNTERHLFDNVREDIDVFRNGYDGWTLGGTSRGDMRHRGTPGKRIAHDSLAIPVINMRPSSQSSQSTISRKSSTSSWLKGSRHSSGSREFSDRSSYLDSRLSFLSNYSNETIGSFQRFYSYCDRRNSNASSRAHSLLSKNSRSGSFNASLHYSDFNQEIAEETYEDDEVISVLSKHF